MSDNNELKDFDVDAEFGETRIEEVLDLSVRSFNCLRRAGINTIGELCALTSEDLHKIGRLGWKAIDDIERKLGKLGLRLNYSPEELSEDKNKLMEIDEDSEYEDKNRLIELEYNFYMKYAEQGIAVAQYKLGEYYYGENDAYNTSEIAIYWWILAAKQGHAEAQYKLGELFLKSYYDGCLDFMDTEKINEKEAVKWLTLAAEQGHADAQYMLGLFYLHDVQYQGWQASEINVEEGLKWYKFAALQGHEEAQRQLIYIYENGIYLDDSTCILQDLDEAIKWYKLAAEQGDIEAKNRLDELLQKDDVDTLTE